MYKEKIVNVETGEETWRDFTEAEVLEIRKAQEKIAKDFELAETRRLNRLALLEKLGITEEEAELLLS